MAKALCREAGRPGGAAVVSCDLGPCTRFKSQRDATNICEKGVSNAMELNSVIRGN